MSKHASESSYTSQTLKLFSGNLVAQIITVASAPFLSRMFPPEAYGTAMLVLSILSIVSLVAGFRYETAVLLESGDPEAFALVRLAVRITQGFTLVTALAVGVTLWLQPEATPSTAPLILLIPLVWLAGMYTPCFSWLTRRGEFGFLASLRVTATAASAGFKLIAGWLGHVSALPLVAAHLFFYGIPALLGGRRMWKTRPADFNVVPPGRMAEKYRGFAAASSGASLLNQLAVQLPYLLLATFFSRDVVGHFGQVAMLFGMPLVLVGAAVGNVFYRRTVVAQQQGRLEQEVGRTFLFLAATGIGPFLIMGWFAEPVFRLILGEIWGPAGRLASLIEFWLILEFMTVPMMPLLNTLRREKFLLGFNLALVTTRAGTLALGGLLGTPEDALIACNLAAVVCLAPLLFYILRSANCLRRSWLLPALGVAVFSSVVLAAAIVLARAFPFSDPALAGIAATAALISATGALGLVRWAGGFSAT